MVRPCINGDGKKAPKGTRISTTYLHKKNVLDYIREHGLDEAVQHFYGGLPPDKQRKKRKLVKSWERAEETIRSACSSGRGSHRNLRELGEGTVLNKASEQELVLWINSIRMDGAPVSRMMLVMRAQEVALEQGLSPEQFAASPTWFNLFLHRHKFSLRARTRQGQTTPEDASEQAQKFRKFVLNTMIENSCSRVYNADQTAVFFEYAPKHTINSSGAKTVWIRCGNKDKERATVMLLGDSEGYKYEPFIVFKSGPATHAEKQAENNSLRNGFGEFVWREIENLHQNYDCQICGNAKAWWNSKLSIIFLKHHFGVRDNMEEKILLLWDDFSGHWTSGVCEYASSINVLLLKVPPKYTYVCQPADIAWNQPFKTRLRGQWVAELQRQLSCYSADEPARRRRRASFDEAVQKAHEGLTQNEAAENIAELRSNFVETPFKLDPPRRPELTQWIMASWADLSTETIISGFAKVGLTTDQRTISEDDVSAVDLEATVTDFENLCVADDEIDSDDDIDKCMADLEDLIGTE